MTVNGIDSRSYYKNTGSKNAVKQERTGGFEERLLQTLGNPSGNTDADKMSDTGNTAAGCTAEGKIFAAAAYRYYAGKTEEAAGTAEMHQGAVRESRVRNIAASESDYSKASVLEGYSIKTKVDTENKSVYVEMKNEDGTVQGYEADISKINQNTADPVEKAALEAWDRESGETKAGTQENTQKTVEEALLDFYNYIEERMKNGPPKIQIGGAELSNEEWQELIEKVDGNLEDIRKELEERIKAQQAEQAQEEDGQNMEPVQKETGALISKLFEDREADTTADETGE